MKQNSAILVSLLCLEQVGAWVSSSAAFSSRNAMSRDKTALGMAAVGIFYGTSTGSTETAAEKIYEVFGSDVASEPIDVDTLGEGEVASAFNEHGALVVGTPTWNTGADTERSGTGWDELYSSQLPGLKESLQGKKVAVFGLGDQVSYAENYADAAGELFDVFDSLGCSMLGSWSQEGYEHEASKSIRGDKFCGLLLDMVNQEEMTDDRVTRWVAQLKAEGILDGTGTSVAPTPAQDAVSSKTIQDQAPVAVPAAVEDFERENELLLQMQEGNELMEQNLQTESASGFTPHFNPLSGKTMWTSPDGRKSYVTAIQKTSTTRNISP